MRNLLPGHSELLEGKGEGVGGRVKAGECFLAVVTSAGDEQEWWRSKSTFGTLSSKILHSGTSSQPL
jgi:hypothetical protein